MKIKNQLQSVAGVVTVQIEGFFTERFINLCRTNNVKIWNVRNITSGLVSFDIYISEFKKLRKIAKKTKCKVKIKSKKGIYFFAFKYRKRKLFIILAILLIISVCTFSNFIWNIKIVGNEKVDSETIYKSLKDSGFKIGKLKVGTQKSEIANKVRADIPEISWLGIDFSGTTAYVKVIEKTKISDENIQENANGDIVAIKNGIITKIIPENGTALYKEGSYVEEGMKLIEGKIYSKILEERAVSAKGIVMANVEYSFEKEYYYNIFEKVYNNKKRWSVGITINSKEYMINYLNKSLKYDKIKKSKGLNVFGMEISFDLYSFDEYTEVEKIVSKDEIMKIASDDADSYLKDSIIPNCKNGTLVNTFTDIVEKDDKIICKSKYVVNEQIGEFRKNE